MCRCQGIKPGAVMLEVYDVACHQYKVCDMKNPSISLVRRNDALKSLGVSANHYKSLVSAGLMPPMIKRGVFAFLADYEITAINRAKIRGASDDEIKRIVADIVSARRV